MDNDDLFGTVDESLLEQQQQASTATAPNPGRTSTSIPPPPPPPPAPTTSRADGSFTNVAAAIERSANDGSAVVLGCYVLWTCAGLEVERAEALFKAEVAGLDLDPEWPESLFPKPEARGALAKALKHLALPFKPSRHKLGDGDFAFSLDAAAIQRASGSATVDVSWTNEQVIQYSAADQSLKFKTPYQEPEIRTAFARYFKTLLADDVSEAFRRALVKARAIRVLKTGPSVFFVTPQNFDIVNRLEAFASSIGATFECPKVLATAAQRVKLARSASDDVEDEIKAAEDDFAKILEDMRDDKAAGKKGVKVRASTLDARLVDFNRIRDKTRCYADVLAFKAVTLEERLVVLEGRARDLIAASGKKGS